MKAQKLLDRSTPANNAAMTPTREPQPPISNLAEQRRKRKPSMRWLKQPSLNIAYPKGQN